MSLTNSNLPVLHCIVLKQREELLKQEIDRLGIEARFWPAIVGGNTIQNISLAHKQIIKWAKDNKLPEIFVAEDDILFTSLYSYQYFIEKKPADYDLYLGGIYGGVVSKDKTLHGFTGMTIFSCHSRFFDKFLSVPTTKNIDRAMTGLGRFVCCNPLIAKQRNGYSFHRKKEVNDDHFIAHRQYLTDSTDYSPPPPPSIFSSG